jgi:cysteine desulfurase
MPVYLDCAASAPVDPRVTANVVRFIEAEFGNAGSRTHEFGARARQAVEHARDQVAAVVACTRGEVVFTSGATESNNLAILGLADYGRQTGRRHIVSTLIEHNAVLEPLRHLAQNGFELTLVPPNAAGWVEPGAVAGAVRPDTLLVCIMQVNNETGIIQPIEQIASLLEGHAAYMHVDAAQGFGKEIAALRHARIDLISISGHKAYAPKGIGALVTRRRGDERPPLAPLMYGGGQERGLRPGTLPVQLIVGLGTAAELALADAGEWAAGNRQFRARAMAALRALDPVLIGDQERVVPHILNLSFPGVDAEQAMEALGDVVAISNGSACTSQSLSCSHVLGAMGVGAAEAQGALRLSWCHLTPEPDWARFVEIVEELRRANAWV